mmetsp:Transcript_25837/g.41391  ORF Transcript_25837/g.41391 Transcript_25837/m.41391 type:complete len:143 (-) Transcript_25837:169-597(-)
MALPMKAMKAVKAAMKAKAMKQVMKKAMKATAMKKVMKKAVKKAMKKSTIANGQRRKVVVFRGTKLKTSGGLKRADLIKSKTGKVVSRKASAAGKKAYASINSIKGWTDAVQKARRELGVKGFVAIKKGTALYKAAKAIYTA